MADVFISGDAIKGKQGDGYTITFICIGGADEAAARTAVDAYVTASYPTYGGYPYDGKPGVASRLADGAGWEVEITYTPDEEDDSNLAKASWSFSSGGGQVQCFVSPYTVVYDAPDTVYTVSDTTKKFINYDKEAKTIGGCTIPDQGDAATLTIPCAESKTKPNTAIFYNHKYKVNSIAWGVHPANSVLYIGSDASYNPDKKTYSVTHNFWVGKNVTDQTIDTITGVAKDAFDVVDYIYNKVEGSSELEATLTNIKVHKVYYERTFDFGSVLGINPDGSTYVAEE